MSMIEKALGIALQWAVFEPNGFLTRARATMTATFFLDALHEAGMLAGATPEESFYVRCDLDNNPSEQRDLGELVIEIGVAPAQPFEFIVLRVGRVRDSLEVRDSGSWLGATGTGV
jgi:phage tail sheath protein FI